jgi:23S rRNA (cytosine1962-C5)-methyltransferase
LTSSEPTGQGIRIKPGRDTVLRRTHHPWVYSQAVQDVAGSPSQDALLPVLSSEGDVIGWGFHSPRSLIAVRMVSYGPDKPPEDWLERRLDHAYALRLSLGLDTDAYRLVNAEGDGIPGLIADVYGDTVVVSMHIRGIEASAARLCSRLGVLLSGTHVYLKREEHYGRVEDLTLKSGYLAGTGDGTSTIREGGSLFHVDFARGQKTGFYLDQRENRRIAAALARGRAVLNLFSYTGAFAIQAARSGAARAVSVESSRPALEIAARSEALNTDIPPGLLEWAHADVFSYLESAGRFDMVIADPPPFARRRADVNSALKGYLTLNQQALRLLNPGGLLLAFSCSGAVDAQSFRTVLAEAAARSRRQVRFLRELHADVDHPVAAAHPEGEYLKGWLMHAQ